METGIAQILSFVDRLNFVGGHSASKTLSPTDLEVMRDYYHTVGDSKGEERTSQYVDLLKSLDSHMRPDADSASVIVLHNFVDAVLGAGSTDAIEAELQSMVDNGLMWVSCNGEASSAATTRRCENRLADVEDKVHCVVPFSTLPTCNKLRSVLCCWAGQDHPLVADNCRFIDPRNKLNYGWSGRDRTNMLIGACFGYHARALPLRFHAYQQDNPVGQEVTLCMNRGDVYFFSRDAIGSDYATPRPQPDMKVTWRHVHSNLSPPLPMVSTESGEDEERERLKKAIRKGAKIVRQRCSFLR